MWINREVQGGVNDSLCLVTTMPISVQEEMLVGNQDEVVEVVFLDGCERAWLHKVGLVEILGDKVKRAQVMELVNVGEEVSKERN